MGPPGCPPVVVRQMVLCDGVPERAFFRCQTSFDVRGKLESTQTLRGNGPFEQAVERFVG